MSFDILTSLIQSRFDVNLVSPKQLYQEHRIYFGNALFYENARKYLDARFTFLVQQIYRGETVFPSNLFHALIGRLVTGQFPKKDEANAIIEYLFALRYQGGFLTAPQLYIQQFPKLRSARSSPMVPEVYSSYYSYFTLKMLGVSFSKSDLENFISWIIAHQKNSGAIYNNEYSDTPEQRRFETELTSQTYFGVSLISSISRQLPEFNLDDSVKRAINWAVNRWQSLRTIAGRYFALKSIYLAIPDQLGIIGTAETTGFLEDRATPEGEGYYDYRLSDKIDEFMSSSSSIELDKISPHVFSTYYAISILKMLWISGASLVIPHDRIKRLAEKAANPDSGFGMKVEVKDFQEPYGLISTELETLLILLFPLLVKTKS